MNSHRLIAVVGAAALAACLTACSAGTNTDASASAAAGAETNTDTASTPGAPASAVPTAPATANYTAPADNQVAPLLTVTHVPQGHSLVENTDNNSRLTFATASTADDTTLESGSAYMIRLADEGTTVDTVIQGNAELSTLDASAFTTTGEASVDGETAQTYQGAGPVSDGSGYVAERGAVVTHNGKTFIIEGIALDKSSQPTVSEEEFTAFLKGIVWTD
jgi:lipoprotein